MEIQIFEGKIYKLQKNEKYFKRGTKWLHRIIWEHHYGKIPDGHHIHHIDGDRHNNDISNLQLIDGKEHSKLHSKKRWEENYNKMYDNFTLKGQECAKEWHKSEEGKVWHSQQAKQSYANRPIRTLICEVCGKEYQTKHTGITKYCHNNCKAKALRRRHKKRK
jgi:hypothetical protein